MNLKNKYQKFSKINEPKFCQLLRLFALDLTASDTAKLTGVSIRSVNSLYLKLHRGLADECGRQCFLERRLQRLGQTDPRKSSETGYTSTLPSAKSVL